MVLKNLLILLVSLTFLSACGKFQTVDTNTSNGPGGDNSGSGNPDPVPPTTLLPPPPVTDCVKGTIAWDYPTVKADPTSSMSIEADLDGYKLFMGNSTGSYSTEFPLIPPASRTFTLPILKTGVDYYLAIKAVGKNGLESDYSNEVYINQPNCSPTFFNSTN